MKSLLIIGENLIGTQVPILSIADSSPSIKEIYNLRCSYCDLRCLPLFPEHNDSSFILSGNYQNLCKPACRI